MSKPFTSEYDEEIATLYQQGWTTYQIGDKFGVSPTPIATSLRRQGIPLRKGGKQPVWDDTPENRTEMASLYRDEGLSLKSIKKRTGCPIGRALQVLKEEHIQMRPHGTDIRALSDEQAREVVKAYQDGATLKELGRQYGTTDVTIRNYLVREGITLRIGGPATFWTTERRTETVKRYFDGESQQQIANSLGINQVSVSIALRSFGISTRRSQQLDNNPRWKGGRRIDGQGYVQVKPTRGDLEFVPMLSTGYVLEHRLVMARTLGRPLLKTETVHHIDGNRQNNDPSNLQLRQGSHGKGITLRCSDCGSHRVEAVPILYLK